MRLKRDKWGQFRRHHHTLAWVFLALAMIATGLVLTHDLDAIEYQAVEVVDNRDGIQKVVDAYAVAFREMQHAEVEYNKALDALNKKTDAYNLKAKQLQTYTK